MAFAFALAVLAVTLAPTASALADVADGVATPPVTPGQKLKIPASVQATAEIGVVVRVKEIVVGEDVTRVTVSASYSGRFDVLRLAWAHSPTYLEDADGQRFPLQRPDDNPWLDIENNKTMQGELVFIGRISAQSRQVRLVFNEGNEGDTHLGPGLSLTIPLS
jgi:hypothetical protein